MGITEIMEAIGLVRGAIGLVKDTKDLLPAAQQEAVGKALEQADAASKAAEIKLAKELGYDICQCTWPPQIMLRTSIGRRMGSGASSFRYDTWKCPVCGTETSVSASAHRA